MPQIRLAHLPTANEAMPRLSASLGGPRLWVKRDDQTGLAFGGNKTRKLEYVLAEAQATGAKTLITAGAIQSNHCRQTAALAARFGLGCILVLAGDGELPVPAAGGNRFLDGLFGAEIVWTSRGELDATLQETFNQAWAAGKRTVSDSLRRFHPGRGGRLCGRLRRIFEPKSPGRLDRAGLVFGRHASRPGSWR